MGRTEKPLRHREYRGLYRQHFRKQSLKPTQGAKAEQKGIRAFIFKDKCRLSWGRKICPRTKSRFVHRDRRPCNFQNPMCIFYRTSPDKQNSGTSAKFRQHGYIFTFSGTSVRRFCVPRVLGKDKQTIYILSILQFLLIFDKKTRFDFTLIIWFSLDKSEMKWYNQSTFVTEVLP